MKIVRILFFFFYLIFFNVNSQEIAGKVLDSLNLNPIQFATIITNFNSNTITNEDGYFKVIKNSSFTDNDSIYISSIGYSSVRYSIGSQLEVDNLNILLPPKSIDLESVTVQNREKLSVEQILKNVRNSVMNTYEFGHRKKRIFRRATDMSGITKFDIKIKNSSIKEFDQALFDSVTNSIPRKNNSYYEVISDYHGNLTDPELQKINIVKSLVLKNEEGEITISTIEEKIQPIVDLRMKPDSYFKFRSGIFPVDIEADGVNFRSIDSTNMDQLKKIEKSKKDEIKSYNESNRNITRNFTNDYLKNGKKLNFEIFKSPRKFKFILEKLAYIGYEPVYVINFSPNSSSAKYKGKIYVHADDFALIRYDYQNTKLIRDFNLLGVSFSVDDNYGTRIFKKNDSGKYDLYYFSNSYKTSFGLDRPLKIIEKNKNVKGRRKQNQLKMQLNFNGNNQTKVQYIVLSDSISSKSEYDQIINKEANLPTKVIEYNPNFWSGYNIIEPTQILKEFKIEN